MAFLAVKEVDPHRDQLRARQELASEVVAALEEIANAALNKIQWGTLLNRVHPPKRLTKRISG